MSTMHVTLEPGNIHDLDSVMAVMDEGFDATFGEAWTAAQCAGLLPMPGVWLTLARAGDEVVGFALSRIVLREAELLLLAVRPSWHRQGIGTQLVDSFVRSAFSRGAERLHLEVREGNRAVNLYKQVGFSEVGRRRNYYSGARGEVYDALTFSKLLNG